MFQPQSLNIGTQMKFKMAQMYQNQLSWQNQLKCIKISSVVKTALLSRIQGTDGSIFHPDVQKNETLFLFNKVYISLIRLYFKNFSPRICANLFPWNTRRRQFTTASQPIGKLINHVQNCVTGAPLLYFIRSWVALSFKCESVSEASVTPVQISTFCNI